MDVFVITIMQKEVSHLERIVQLFKKNNKWNIVCVIIIDKDFSEYKVLKQEFPDAVLLYRQWHVIKAWFKCLSDYIMDKCHQLICQMVYVSNLEEYENENENLFNSTSKEFQRYIY